MGVSQNVSAWATQAATVSPQTDTDAPWAENATTWPQVNNYARSNMSALKRKFDDLGGQVTTTGTGEAYIVATNSAIDVGHLVDGYRIGVWAHLANTIVAPTIAVDGHPAKIIKRQDGTALAVGSIQNGTFLDLAYEATAGVFCAANIPSYTTAAVGGIPVEIVSTDASATFGPAFSLYRNSPSAVGSDQLGILIFYGQDNAVSPVGGNKTAYGYLQGIIHSAGDGSEYGKLRLSTLLNNVDTPQVDIGGLGGVLVGASTTGGAKGTGTLNATTLYQAGTALGTMAIQNASAVAITGGTISGASVTSSSVALSGGTMSGVAITGGSISGVSGLGTGGTVNYGTSGSTVPLLNTSVTWDGNSTFNGTQTFYQSSSASYAQIIGSTAPGVETAIPMVLFYDVLAAQQMGAITSNNSANTTNYGGSSDLRLKDRITDLDAGDVIDRLRPIMHGWIGKDRDIPLQAGFIAQEVAEVVPLAVSPGGDDPKSQPWMMDAGKLMPFVVAELKALRARVAELEAKLAGTN